MARILICDDAVFMRKTVREILEAGGHEIVGEASSGHEGVTMYRKLSPDLVTMDILMVDSGVDAVKSIIKHDRNAKIIMVSILNEQEGDVVAAIRAGALGLVTKPVKKEILLAEVNRVLEREGSVG